jgi:hypothetical protein
LCGFAIPTFCANPRKPILFNLTPGLKMISGSNSAAAYHLSSGVDTFYRIKYHAREIPGEWWFERSLPAFHSCGAGLFLPRGRKTHRIKISHKPIPI